MTDKEKAKAYDEALKRAKITLDCCGSTSIITKNTIYDIFPELQESEDEKVRKEIVSIFHSLAEGKIPSPINYADIFTWLEKQGEPQDKGEISDGYHTFNELYYYRMLYNAAFFNMLPKEWVHKSKKHHDGEDCFGGGWFIVMANLPTGQISNHYELKNWDLFQIPEKEVADKWDGHTPQEAADRLHKYLLEKQVQELRKVSLWKHWKDGICGNGEGELIYLIKDGNDYRLSSSLSFECDYIELSDLDNLMLEKQAEVESDNDDIEAEEKDIRKAFKKIWDEKQSVQKSAWSEEDEIKIKSIIAFLKSPSLCAMDGNKGIIDANIKYLKSLKNKVQPQNTWKPSDEQITVLELASKYERVFTPKQIDILIGLKEQLKKLKE